MILEKLVAAGIGNRPVVFVTHRLVYYLPFLSVCLVLQAGIMFVWSYKLA